MSEGCRMKVRVPSFFMQSQKNPNYNIILNCHTV